ncbi:MAG: outer membrane protein assembly factor BamE [Gammaproteobacteria bacterium]|nr:outer membrane protein assembly factor BamE [Gammaproteobacteria bacterium]
MQKPLAIWTCWTGLILSGCSTLSDMGEAIPDALGRTSLMYRIDIQQGNVIEQEMVNRLEPGMSKSQVRYIMGSPLLVDVFHQDRWDFYYSMGKGKRILEQKQVSLFFEDDRLIRLEGDLKPLPPEEITDMKEARVYPVPDYEKRTGVLGGLTRWMEKYDPDLDGEATDTTGTGDVEALEQGSAVE